MQTAAGKPDDYMGINIIQLNDFVLFSLSKALLVDQMEVLENDKYAKARAALDVRFGWIAAASQLKESATKFLRLPRTWGSYILIRFQCPPQTGHNYFECGKNWSPGYFMLVTDEQDIAFWVCLGSHLHVDYSTDEKLTLAKAFKMQDFFIKKKSVFVEHGYVQHVGSGWERDAALRCHTYVLSEGTDLKYAVSFSYCDSLRKMPMETKRQLIEVHSDNENSSDADAERVMSEEVHSSERVAKRSPLLTGTWAVDT